MRLDEINERKYKVDSLFYGLLGFELSLSSSTAHFKKRCHLGKSHRRDKL